MMGEIERLARLIAKAQHADLAPDDRIHVAEPQRRGLPAGFSVVPHQMDTTPLWAIYAPAARAIIDDIERQKERE